MRRKRGGDCFCEKEEGRRLFLREGRGEEYFCEKGRGEEIKLQLMLNGQPCTQKKREISLIFPPFVSK